MTLWILAGFAALYVPLLIFYWIAGGTPFLEFVAVAHSNAARGNESGLNDLLLTSFIRGLQDFWSSIRTAEFYEVQRILLTHDAFHTVARPAAACVVAGLILRPGTHQDGWARRCAVLWLLMLYLTYEFGTPFLPLRKVPRYLQMFDFPMAAVIVTTLSPYLNRRALAPGVILGLICGAAYYALFAGRPPAPIALVTGLMGIAAILTVLIVRRCVPQMLATGLLVLTLLLSSRQLGVGLTPHTRLSRAVRCLNLPDPVYTNSWRTRMMLQCLPLHDRGSEGVVLACEAGPIVEGLHRGKAVVIYTRPSSRYIYCALSQEETARLVREFDRRAEKHFDNGLYKIYQNPGPDFPLLTNAP